MLFILKEIYPHALLLLFSLYISEESQQVEINLIAPCILIPMFYLTENIFSGATSCSSRLQLQRPTILILGDVRAGDSFTGPSCSASCYSTNQPFGVKTLQHSYSKYR